MTEVMGRVLEGVPGNLCQRHEAEQLVTLPMRMGGFWLRSACRMAKAAYWASWANALPMPLTSP